MTPTFNRGKFGYDMRQVDAYIDSLHAENQQLARVNDELLLLYLKELRQLSQEHVTLPETSEHSKLTTEEINRLIDRSYAHRRQAPQTAKQKAAAPDEAGEKKRSRFRVPIAGLIFYLGLAALIFMAYMAGAENEARPPRNIFGFSVMTVLTRSMQDEIPQDALIVTRRVPAETIQVGDNITFITPQDTTITHQVVEIEHNFAGTGMPGFVTRGVMNLQPDAEIVPAENVVGRVIFQNLTVGRAVLFIRTNVILIIILTVLTIAIITGLRKFFYRSDPRDAEDAEEAPKEKGLWPPKPAGAGNLAETAKPKPA